MKSIMRIEIHRAFCNRMMASSLIVGTVIVMAHIVQYVLPQYITACLIEEMAGKNLSLFPKDVFGVWLGGGTYSMESFLYYLLLPILAVLPFGGSYFEDRKGGLLKNICIRTEKKRYLKAKLTAAFLSGGMAFVVPLIVSLLICATLFPSLIPQPSSSTSAVSAFSIFYEIYFTHPYLYILIYLAIDFIYAGIMAVIALAATMFTEYKFMVLITPFIFYIFIFSVCNLFDHLEYSPVYMLNGGYGQGSYLAYIIQVLLLGIISIGVYFKENLKSDIY